MADSVNENVIEFLRGQQRATATFCYGRMANRMKKLASEYPEECQIVAENPDGSVVAHFPTKWVKVAPPRKMSEEQKEMLVKRLAQYRE